METVKAHSSTVWSLHVRPDEQVLVSGSADKEVKFWEFERNVSSNDEVSVSLFEYALCNLNHELTFADQKVNDNKSHTNVEDVG
jgi:U3 small nucleolar RNA-associated protein 12